MAQASVTASGPGYKSITVLGHCGQLLKVAEQLFDKGYQMVDIGNARGTFIGASPGSDGTPVEVQQEVLTCVVEVANADEAFDLIFDLAGVGQPGGGFMYMQSLQASMPLRLPTSS
jgi:nitrogen regulatory protein PII